MQRIPYHNVVRLRDIILLLSFLSCFYFALLGVRPLFTPDEGRYAEIAREMVVNHDYVTPYLNHIKYFEKPIFFYWLETLAISLFGLSLWSVRSVNVLLSLLGCLATYYTATKLYNRLTGLFAAFILGTSTLYFVMTNMVSLDLPVTVFIAISLYAFLLGVKQPNKQLRFFSIAAVSAALAVLAKGLMGIVLPGLIISIWTVLFSQWRQIKWRYIGFAFLVFLLVAVPWHIIVNLRNPEFFNFYFIQQQVLRYTTKGIGHYQPVWFFIPYLIVGFFPWILFLPASIAKIKRFTADFSTSSFFAVWFVVIFSFFSFSKSKLIPYILPVFPALALLTANYLQQSFMVRNTAHLKRPYAFLILLSILLAVGFYFFLKNTPVPHLKQAQFYFFIGSAILISGSILCYKTVTNHPYSAFFYTVIAQSLFLLCLLAAQPYIDNRSILPLANTLKTVMQPQDEVIAFNQYYQDLPFYLEKRITILNWRNELTFGMQHQSQDWMIDDAVFVTKWTSSQRVFAIMGKDNFSYFKNQFANLPYFLIDQTLNNVLISNQTNG